MVVGFFHDGAGDGDGVLGAAETRDGADAAVVGHEAGVEFAITFHGEDGAGGGVEDRVVLENVDSEFHHVDGGAAAHAGGSGSVKDGLAFAGRAGGAAAGAAVDDD
ncbi:MAG: hypothetical protein FD180_53 [Planctomycetota bacterium]|nr:MAG: hypothetical protein FD180_53 [Planctomycetota bacterium]